MSTPARPSQCSISKVRVVVRVRPFLPHEITSRGSNSTPCVSVLDSESDPGREVTVFLKDQETSRNECYKLDSFFGKGENNLKEIFDRELTPLISGLFHGCNSTVFAYGATGSGKTYTMQGTEEIPGLIPLAVSTILSLCHNTGSSAEISYYEVYMDRCYDLMEDDSHEISILEDKDGNVHLKGLSRVHVSCMVEFHKVFSVGNQRRKVGHTALNDVSSRSHGVVTITVLTPTGDGSGVTTSGKLHLIDLAGNEDNRRSCNEGIRLLESGKINQSLFALSNVVYAINNNKARIPYRESKLTRILQDSLGGTSRALMVACLNPGEYQESVHTVSLAARSRHISNFVSSAQKNVSPKVDMEEKLRVWLESKGKAQSAQRMQAFGSPFLCAARTPMSSTKKPHAYLNSSKQKCKTDRGASNAKERSPAVLPKNLFTSGGFAEPSIKEDQLASISEDGSSKNVSISQLNDALNQLLSLDKLESAGETAVETSMQRVADDLEKNSGKMTRIFVDQIVSESVSNLSDQLSDKVEKTTEVSIASFDESSPICGEIRAVESCWRKVLSPINSNIESISRRDQNCLGLLDPKTPKTPLVFRCTSDMPTKTGTPLDRLNALGSGLKSSLVEEYIEFLNTASREELMELKGIGQKIAEYILELRERSPLRSLNDLEKVGLSSKQVQNMFSKTARGIFG